MPIQVKALLDTLNKATNHCLPIKILWNLHSRIDRIQNSYKSILCHIAQLPVSKYSAHTHLTQYVNVAQEVKTSNIVHIKTPEVEPHHNIYHIVYLELNRHNRNFVQLPL